MKLKLSKAEGQRKKEAVGINSSLSVLGKAPPRARVACEIFLRMLCTYIRSVLMGRF